MYIKQKLYLCMKYDQKDVMCRFTLDERKKSAEFKELLEPEPVSLKFKEDRLGWFGDLLSVKMMLIV